MALTNPDRFTHSLSEKLSITSIVFGLVIALSIVAFILLAENRIIGSFTGLPVGSSVLLLGVGLFSVYLIFLNERLWIWITIAAMLSLVFRPTEGGFGPAELIYALYVPLGLVVWFTKETMVYRNQIIYSTFDWFLLLAVLLCMCTASIGSLYFEGSFRLYSREFLSFLSILLYYPYRKSMQSDRDIIILVGVVVGVALINGLNNLATYQQQVVESALRFGEVNARVASYELLSVVLICVAFAWLAFTRSIKTIPVSMAILVSGIAFLLMTLSRGPIAAATIGVFLALFLVPPRRAAILIAAFLTALTGLILTLLVVLPGFSQSIIGNVTSRIETFERLESDHSFNSRLYEAKGALKAVAVSPAFGYGYGVRFSFYDKPFQVTGRTGFIHNGYVAMLYKYGIPAGLFLMFVLLLPLIRLPFSSLKTMSRNHQMFAVGALTALVSMLITNFTSNSISAYISLTLYALCYATLDYVYTGNKYREGFAQPREKYS